MYKAIHHDGQKSLVHTAEYVRRHDLIYENPALEPYHGLPLGNGQMGGLLYHTANGLAMQVNHTDALDFGPDGPMKVWAWEAEEKNTAPVSLGSLFIESTLPCFDWVYLEEYKERLNLAEACVEGMAKTPFSLVKWKCFASEEPGVLAFSVDAYFEEEAAFTIRGDRWSSPNFFHHYEQVVPLYGKNLSNISAEVKDESLVITQELGGNRAVASIEVQGKEKIIPELLHSRGGEFRLPKSREHHFQVLFCGEAGQQASKEHCREILDTAWGADTLFERHKEKWHCFWNTSFLHLEGEDYLENLYYMNLYQLNCCSRGKYPVTFAGLWSWFKDSRNWGHFYHWNHQQNYWGILDSGHGELFRNYLEYRFRMIPAACEDARKYFHAQGAFFSDVSNYNGFNAIEPDTIRNCSVGAQIALDFYRYYAYTMDEEFLKDRAVPMIQACTAFYTSILTGEEGSLHIEGGSACYESYWNLKETITDYASLKAVLKAVEKIGEKGFDKDFLHKCRKLEESLSKPLTQQVTHKGQELEIFCAGRKWDGDCVKYGEGEYPWSPFPASLMAPVYPCGLIGLGKKGTAEFEIMENTARVLLDREVYQMGVLGCSGHAPAPELAARLGMKEDILPVLHKFASSYQVFHNGLMHFADISANQQWSPVDTPRILSGDETATQWEELHEKTKGTRTAIPSKWFLHAYFEAAANLTAGMNEMMLQSYEGIIRIFPALPKKGTAMFTLYAQGGFQVTGEAGEGEIRYVEIKSLAGERCYLADPWEGEAVSVLVNGVRREELPYKDGVFSFPTEKEDVFLFYRTEFPPECYYHNPYPLVINEKVKTMGNVQLGKKKYY